MAAVAVLYDDGRRLFAHLGSDKSFDPNQKFDSNLKLV